MKWEIRGTKDGKQIRAKVTADSEEAARAKAIAGGVTVLSVLPMETEAPAPVAYEPAAQTQPPDASAAAYAPPTQDVYATAPAPAGASMAVASPPFVSYATPTPHDTAYNLALASVICGGVGTVLSFLFCIWPLSILLALAGIGMGIAAWVMAKKRQSSPKFAMVGTFVSCGPFLVLMTIAIIFGALIHSANKAQATALVQQQAQQKMQAAADQTRRAQEEADSKAHRERDEAERAAREKADAERRAAQQQASDEARAKSKAEAEARAQARAQLEADKKAADADRKAADAAKKAELDVPVAVSAEDLLKAYTENSVAADAAYKNHMVDVQGTILTLRKNSINLAAGGDKRGIQCSIAPSAQPMIASLKTGQMVTVHGRCTGGSLRGVNVHDATITP